MKPVKLSPLNAFNEALCKAHIKLIIKMMDCVDSPAQRALMQLSAGATLVGLSAGTAYAQSGGGVAGMVTVAADQGEIVKLAAGRLFAAIGFIGAGWGGYNWWRKGKEGEDSRIKGGQIAWPIIGGAVLGATGFVMIRAGETVGIQGSSHGQLPPN
jgi:hypothetical protein